MQTGDKTGTGAGGESFYGEQFEDEIHPRLRFSHRGLVACANNGSKNSNDSQFIITLDRADELHGKHTLFGRCVGDSIYNVLKIGEKELDGNERPLYPPKIKTIRVTENPFPDIVPRITAAEKRAQQRAREQGQKEREEAARRKGAKKDVKLLSFGADEDAEEEAPTTFKKKTMARPDLVENPESKSSALPDFASMGPPPSASAHPKTKEVSRKESLEKSAAEKKKSEKEVDITKIREKHAKEQSSKSASRLTEIEKMEAEIRKMTKRRDGGDSSDEDGRPKKKKRSYLDEELSKYKKNNVKRDRDGKKVKDEKDIIAAMNSFRGRLQDHDEDDEPMEDGETGAAEDGERPAVEEAGQEVDDDVGFLAHRLRFPKDSGEESVKAERDYEVIDPRQRGARAKEEERERKRQSGGKKQRR